jgi:hypothetical protein
LKSWLRSGGTNERATRIAKQVVIASRKRNNLILHPFPLPFPSISPLPTGERDRVRGKGYFNHPINPKGHIFCNKKTAQNQKVLKLGMDWIFCFSDLKFAKKSNIVRSLSFIGLYAKCQIESTHSTPSPVYA